MIDEKRRRFLKQSVLGLSSAALLPTILGGGSARAVAGAPQRLICFLTFNGFYTDSYASSGGETDFTLGPVLSPLEPLRDKCLFLTGVECGTAGHGPGTTWMLTASGSGDDATYIADGPSLDFVMAPSMGEGAPIQSMVLGVRSGAETASLVSYTDGGVGVVPTDSPIGAFERLSGAATADPNQGAFLRERHGSVLDAVKADFDDLQSLYTPEERRLLDAHLTSVEELESRVTQPPPPRDGCALPARPSGDGFEAECTAQIDNLVLATQCDLARVMTLSLSRSQSPITYEWLGQSRYWHDIAHSKIGGANSTEMEQVQTWHAQQFADLCTKLDAIPEANGATALDNSIVMWISELGFNDGGDHNQDDTPVVIAGGAGALTMGRMLKLNRTHGDLLLTVAHVLGRNDLSSFGADGTSPIESILV